MLELQQKSGVIRVQVPLRVCFLLKTQTRGGPLVRLRLPNAAEGEAREGEPANATRQAREVLIFKL